MNSKELNNLEQFAANFNFTIRGIDAHLRNDEADADAIIYALCNLQDNLNAIIEKAKESK